MLSLQVTGAGIVRAGWCSSSNFRFLTNFLTERFNRFFRRLPCESTCENHLVHLGHVFRGSEAL